EDRRGPGPRPPGRSGEPSHRQARREGCPASREPRDLGRLRGSRRPPRRRGGRPALLDLERWRGRGATDRGRARGADLMVDGRPPLLPHPETALEFLRTHPRAGMLPDMGSGKTRTVLEALTPGPLTALVVAPKRVTELVWPSETTKWRPDLRVEVASGPPAARRRALGSGAPIIAISRDNLGEAVGGPWRTIVFDELSSYKNRSTKRWKAARDLSWKGSAEYVWGLTGTPAPNGLLDLWAQIYLLDRGERLGSGITKYRERYFRAGRQLASGVVTEWLLRPGADRRIHELLEDIALSMSAEDLALSLPPVSDNDIEVPLPANVRRIYREMKDTLVADLDLLGDASVVTAANA